MSLVVVVAVVVVALVVIVVVVVAVVVVVVVVVVVASFRSRVWYFWEMLGDHRGIAWASSGAVLAWF